MMSPIEWIVNMKSPTRNSRGERSHDVIAMSANNQLDANVNMFLFLLFLYLSFSFLLHSSLTHSLFHWVDDGSDVLEYIIYCLKKEQKIYLVCCDSATYIPPYNKHTIMMTWTKSQYTNISYYFFLSIKNHIKKIYTALKIKYTKKVNVLYSVFGFTCESRQYHFDFNHTENSLFLFIFFAYRFLLHIEFVANL